MAAATATATAAGALAASAPAAAAGAGAGLTAATGAGLAAAGGGVLASTLAAVNGSKFTVAACVIVFNMGARYLAEGFTPGQVHLFKHAVTRRLVLFCVLFTATRDVLLAFLLSCAVILVLEVLGNERSRFCILPRALRGIMLQATHSLVGHMGAPGHGHGHGHGTPGPAPSQGTPAPGEGATAPGTATAPATAPATAMATPAAVSSQESQQGAGGSSQWFAPYVPERRMAPERRRSGAKREDDGSDRSSDSDVEGWRARPLR